MQPLVTVLLPCYNAMPFLPEALDSILKQTYKNLEILCINDGSTDDTQRVLEEYEKKDARIKVVHNEENIKLIRTLNKGIELANGKYIARMDADDISLPKRIERSVDYLENHSEIDLVSVAVENLTEDGKKINQQVVKVTSSKAIFYASFLFNPVGHPQTLCKTKLLKDNHYSLDDTVLHTEDYEIWSRLLSKGAQFHVINEIHYQFRINSNSVSRRFTGIQDENFVIQSNKSLSSYLNKNIAIKFSKVINNRMDTIIQYRTIQKGLTLLDDFTQTFIQKEKPNKIEAKEIRETQRLQKFDILFQSLKYTKGWTRIKIASKLSLYTLSLGINKKSRHYILSKF